MKTAMITKASQPRIAFFLLWALHLPARAARFGGVLCVAHSEELPSADRLLWGLPASEGADIRTREGR